VTYSNVVINFDVRDCLVGLHVLPHQLTGKHYRDLPLYDLPKLLEDVPLAVRARMWYMHDGAPAHFSRAVRDVLNNNYHGRWIVREGLTARLHARQLCILWIFTLETSKNPCVCSSC
jgi:hypothetical protein